MKGFIEGFTSRPGQYGMMHSVKIDNINYGTKGTKVPFNEGDYVEFEAVQNAKGYWDADPKSFKKSDAPASASPSTKAQPGTGTKAWQPDGDRQAIIQLQSSRNSAIAMVDLLCKSGAVDISKVKSGADKIEMIELFVDKFTQRFQEDTKRGAPPEHPVVEKATKTKTAPVQEEFKDDEDLPF